MPGTNDAAIPAAGRLVLRAVTARTNGGRATNLTVTAGVRVDVPKFGIRRSITRTRRADVPRSGRQSRVSTTPARSRDQHPLVSAHGFQLGSPSDRHDAGARRNRRLHRQAAYVWISNQIGNTGVLTGFIQADTRPTLPVQPQPGDIQASRLLAKSAASYELGVTDPDFKFPQTWRNNIAIDRATSGAWSPPASTSTTVTSTECLHQREPARSADDGGRRRHSSALDVANRINNATGNQVVQNIVLLNQSVGRRGSWRPASASRWSTESRSRAGYSTARSRNEIDPGSIASGSWTGNPIVTDPNNPVLAYSTTARAPFLPRRRPTRTNIFGLGATTISAFFDAHSNLRPEFHHQYELHLLGGRERGRRDEQRPRCTSRADTSEMNFKPLTVERPNIHGCRADGSVRGVHPAGRISQIP